MVGRVLVVDDEEDFRSVVAEHLEDVGLEAVCAGSAKSALELGRGGGFDVALLDLRMPGVAGLELLDALRALELEVILVTGHATLETAIGALKRGAFDYLLKPCRLAELEAVVWGALEKRRPREAARRSDADADPELLGASPAIRRVRELISRVAATDSTVLIQGESGTGKELAARAVHRQSRRSGKPFVVLHAGALPEGLVESELFGHARGAFTGAAGARKGVLELADRGTLFIDEIGEMPLSAQAKLLRCLESGQIRPLGAEREVRIDVRFVAATNRTLREEVKAGRFREDLFYRLNVFAIEMPPLRERLEDLPPLVERRLRRPPTLQAMEALMAYPWPGNVRELFNALERAEILAGNAPVGLEHLPGELLRAPAASRPRMDLERLEREQILRALLATSGNKVEAAKLLGIPRRTLYRRLERYGIMEGPVSPPR